MVGRNALVGSVVGLALLTLAVSRPLLPPVSVSAQGQPSKVDFGRDVQPIFQQHCVGCHGPAQQMNGLRLDRRRDAMRGGSAGGVVIRPGSGEISALYLKLNGAGFGAQMPPTGALKPEQIAVIKQWIDQGAEWPDSLAGDVEPAPADPAAERLIDAVRSARTEPAGERDQDGRRGHQSSWRRRFDAAHVGRGRARHRRRPCAPCGRR